MYPIIGYFSTLLPLPIIPFTILYIPLSILYIIGYIDYIIDYQQLISCKNIVH